MAVDSDVCSLLQYSRYGFYPLVEIDAFLSELAGPIGGVLEWLVLHHLHPLAFLALLMAVLADHVELPNPVLETQATTQLAQMLREAMSVFNVSCIVTRYNQVILIL